MSRQVIPPMSIQVGDNPSQQTLEVLEKRLQSAEMDTQDLLDRLGGMGFSKNVYPAERDTMEMREVISPYQAKLANIDVLKDNYESLVSRVCKTESCIQSLKLSLLNIQGERDLKAKIVQDDFEEKYDMLKETYEQELGKLRRQLDQVKDELSQEYDLRVKAKEEIKHLKAQIEHAAVSKEEVHATSNELSSLRQKSQRRIAEVKEELERERSLRSSLEESHNTLLGRIREMEMIVESERKEVQSLTNDCSTLRNDALKVREELRNEKTRREMLESDISQLTAENEHFKKSYDSAESDRKLLMSEMSRLRTQYEDLIKQLEQTQVIVDQQKATNKELVEKNQHLTKIVDSSNEEKERLKTMHDQELDAERKRLTEKEKVEEEALQYKLKVKELSDKSDSMKKKLSHVERELLNMNKKYVAKDEEYNKASEGLERELSKLKHQLHVLTKDNTKLTKDKENMLEEVNQTVDSMKEERSKLQKEIQHLKSELETQTKTKRSLEQENATLLDRVSQFEHQRESQNRVEKSMQEMLEQKNKLAYENGKLQTQVAQLTSQVDLLSESSNDAAKYRGIAESVQHRYDSAQREISDLKIEVQRLEHQVHLARGSMESKEQNFITAIQTRDEVMQEKTQLLEKLQSLEDKEKKKVQSLQKNLEDAKSVNKEIASTLEAVMSSHSQLQTIVEGLQIDLGKKDSQIAQLKSEKNKEQEEWKLEMRTFEERMENLREDLKREREKSHKKTSKELAELKKQNDSLQSRNMELVKSNTELRHKQGSQEGLVRDLKDKVTDQKKRIEYLSRSKKELEENVDKMKGMRSEIEELERLRDEYIQRNQEQGEMINTFMNQIASLQGELKDLAKAQLQTKDLMKQRDMAIEKERMLKEEVKRKQKDSKRHKDEVERMKRETEKKLKDAQNESTEVSLHLQDAHDWFKTKFDRLQEEIMDSRKKQSLLEQENLVQKRHLEEERLKAQAAAEKAREMIKASRHTISQLADYAEIADSETKHQLLKLQTELQQEKDHAKFLEMKHQKYKEASARQLESLLKDFSH